MEFNPIQRTKEGSHKDDAQIESLAASLMHIAAEFLGDAWTCDCDIISSHVGLGAIIDQLIVTRHGQGGLATTRVGGCPSLVPVPLTP